ncbi:hypothetical protein FOA52_014457 [Chlamydomonas sp. UWO 241]|nr:hypothetical protein FOA52_014457 [Chlamydomonas sp. UWO 241]
MSGRSRERGVADMEAECSTSTSKDPWTTTSFTNFSKLPSGPVRSDPFEAGIYTWRLKVWPDGDDDDHLAAFLVTTDSNWGPKAEYKMTLFNQADASKSRSYGEMATFDIRRPAWGNRELIKMSELRDAAAGWLMKDTLILTVGVSMERDDRFQLDAGVPLPVRCDWAAAPCAKHACACLCAAGVPCDATLKLAGGAEVPCVSVLLQMASPFFRCALEDVQGGASIPVDGSLGTWSFILSDIYPQYSPPFLTLSSVYMLLPVVHKYDFTNLLGRLVAFVRGKLSHNPVRFHTVFGGSSWRSACS